MLVDRSSGEEVKAWPVKYSTMFHMANDSGLFRTREELEEREGAWPVGGNRFRGPSGEWVPLYEGKMVQAFDHRAASVVNRKSNLFRPGQPNRTLDEEHFDPAFSPRPRYWVSQQESDVAHWLLAFKDITASTNVRTMIAAAIPQVGCGHTLPVLLPAEEGFDGGIAACLLANLNSFGFDYVARQKVQGTHLTWYTVEQLPVVPPDRYEAVHFGPKTAGEIVREAVLELTYTAHDMAPFARDMGYVDKAGEVNPPFTWNEERRLVLRSKLDAVFFHLYGVTDRDDIRYIYSTFPIVERKEKTAYGGVYRSCELCLGWMNALAAGDPEAEIYL